jgi:2-dehydropantoate 2-reductase
MRPRIVVVGAGAVGGYVGGHLHRLGHDVTLVDFWPEHVEAIRREGLRITGTTAAEAVACHPPVLHVTEVQGLSKQHGADIAIVAVKSYDTAWATTLIAQYLAPGGFVVSLQNCVNEEKIAGVVGWGRLVGVIASRISVDLWAPGHIRRTMPMGGPAHTVFRIGEPHGRITARVGQLAAMFAGVDSTKVTENLWGERWTKLVMNGMRNGVSAATGLAGRQMDAIESIRRFSIRLGGEAVRIGQALGFELERIGALDPERLALAAEGDPAALAEVEATMIAGSNREAGTGGRPSMGQDMLKGRRTEIEEMNGYIVAKGAEVGRAAPAHQALVAAVRRVERGEVPAAPEVLSAVPP